MLAGIANILASLAGFLFGSVLVIAAAALALKQYRPAAAVSGAIIMAISMFISLRTVVDLMSPPTIYPFPGIYGSVVAFLMSPSPIFTLFNGAAELQTASPGQPLWWVDLGSNLAALIFNSLGLGFSVLGWTQLLTVEREAAGASQNELPAVQPQP